MARATKPPKRDAWGNALSVSPDIAEWVDVPNGWTAPAGDPVKPPRGSFNFEQNRYDNGLNYLLQRGIPDWDGDETDYGVGDLARDPATNHVYILLGTATPGAGPGNNPAADTANWYLWHRTPRPMAGETAATEIAAWRNAKGYRITGKDHYGFNAGRLLDFKEDWMDGNAATHVNSATSALWFGRWNYAIDNGGGTAGDGVIAAGPWSPNLNTHPWGPLLALNVFGQSVNAVGIVETVKAIAKMSDAALVYDVAFSVNGASGPQTDSKFQIGLADGSLAANRSMGTTLPTAYGAWLESDTGLASWLAVDKPNGGSQTANDTGVALVKDVPHHLRMIIVGINDSDDSNARVITMIDGAIVINRTVSLLNQMLFPFVRTFAHQGEVCRLNLGPLWIQSRLELGDVLL